MGLRKLTERQREEIVIISSLKKGSYPRYPVEYIAALYGVTHGYVRVLTMEAGVPARGRYCTRSAVGVGKQ